MAVNKQIVRVEDLKKETESDISLPEKLTTSTVWEDWELLIINYLESKDSIENIPLSYVIREDTPPALPDNPTDEFIRNHELIYNAPIVGPVYATDNRQVYSILESLTIGQDSSNWIEPATKRRRDGRQAMKDLKHHFDGGDEKYKRLQAARSGLSVLHYKHEKIMSFDKVTTRMKKHYDTIALCDQPETESNKIDTLLKKIKTNNQQLQNVVTIVRGDPIKYNTFTKVTAEFARHIAYLFPPETNTGSGRHSGKRSVSSLQSQQYKKQKTSYGVTTKGDRKFCNNVDITDITRTFSKKEWEKLPRAFKVELYNNPERKRAHKENKNKSRNTSATKSSSGLDDATIGRIVSGVARATMVTNSSDTTAQQPRMGAGGAATRQQKSSSNSSTVSSITTNTKWDADGNIIQE